MKEEYFILNKDFLVPFPLQVIIAD